MIPFLNAIGQCLFSSHGVVNLDCSCGPLNAAGDNTELSSIGLLEAVPLILPSIRLQQRVRTFLRGHAPDIVV